MPEGDVVLRSARRLHAALAGAVLTHTDFRVPRLATADLAGRRVREVLARGKHLLFRVEDGLTLHTHFEMDGAWHLVHPGARWTGGPAYQVRVVLATAEWVALGYRLPVVDLLATRDEDRVVGHLGPDLLGADWDPATAAGRLRAQPQRPLGLALLDQRNLAGIGNLYLAETLFLTGVTPWTPVADVADLPALLETARQLLRDNVERVIQATTGSRHGRHWVYGRAGLPCRRCGTLVRRAEQAEPSAPERARVRYWCPGCQHGPAPPG